MNSNTMFNQPPEKIIWCYSEAMAAYKDLDGVEFFEGVYDLNSLDVTKRTLIVFDDMINCENANKVMHEISIQKSHHMNLSALWLTQNVFASNKYSRTISINASYMILMKSPRDRLQIAYLARQIYPHKNKHLIEAYNDATSSAHGYLLIDFRQSTPEKYRLRTSILPHEQTVVYAQK